MQGKAKDFNEGCFNVMAGLVSAIQFLLAAKTWMPACAGMTTKRSIGRTKPFKESGMISMIRAR